MTFVVVGNDAGGAELLCAFVKKHYHEARWHLFCLPASPMETIARKHGLDTIAIEKNEVQLDAYAFDALLFGTGWQEKSERPFVAYAKARAIPTFAFIDHWSQYRERFGFPEKGWQKNLPDFTVVHDEKALEMATAMDLPRPVALPNYYIRELVDQAKKLPVKSTLLFFGEPTDKIAKTHFRDENHWGFTQYSALREVLEHFDLFGCDSLVVRLHPSESGEGYEKVIEAFPNIDVSINDAHSRDLSEQIMQAKVVIGFDTMALYIAAHFGKRVISYLPSKNRDFSLPLPPSHQIRNLSELESIDLQPLWLEVDHFGISFASFVRLIQDFKSEKS